MLYSVLLGLQILILMAMGAVTLRISHELPRPRLGRAFKFAAFVYALAMIVRMTIGVLDLSSSTWFDGAVSTAFHFVLAAFLLTSGAMLTGNAPAIRWEKVARKVASVSAYPVLIIGGYAMYVWLRENGAPLLFSSYLSAFLGLVGIILHESLAPARENWRPALEEVIQDGLFVAFVQIGVPVTLKALTLVFLAGVSQNAVVSNANFWPHEAPVLVQIMLMLVVAEFFRILDIVTLIALYGFSLKFKSHRGITVDQLANGVFESRRGHGSFSPVVKSTRSLNNSLGS